MRVPSRACDPQQLADLIADRISEQERARLERHLTDCADCRSEFEKLVEADGTWEQVRAALGTSAAGTDVPGTTIGQRPERSAKSDQTWRRLLSPSDDPQMLGRISSYEIVGLLGQGGMGVVFKGLDRSLNRFVAIKMMSSEVANSGPARQRFFREAQAAAAVVHEHVMAIHSVSEWQGTPYLVMPYVRGRSLQRQIADHGALQLRETLRIGCQVASALAAAHAQGLIHRDVKPANILLEQDVERVILADFGLARAVDDIGLTQTNTLVGTPQYMSPEQAADESLDFRTDLFSLGSVLYEMATGRAAFQAVTSYGLLKKINDVEPYPIQALNPDMPDWFVAIVARLMSKNPDDRFATANEVESLLRQCLSHIEQPHLIPPPETLHRSVSKSSVKGRTAMIVAILGAAVLGLSGISTQLLTPNDDQSGFVQPSADEPSASIKDESNVAGADPGGADSVQVALATIPENKGKEKGNAGESKPSGDQYSNAKQAYAVGGALLRTRDFRRAQTALEAAVRMAGTDMRTKMRASEALLLCYREQPNFEPYRDTADFVIDNHYQDAAQSNARTRLLSFAVNRGMLDELVEHYEARLKKDADDWLAVYMLSEIYAGGSLVRSASADPQRAIELLNELTKLDKRREADPARNWSSLPMESLRDPSKAARRTAQIAAQYLKLRDYRRAAKEYEAASKLDEETQAANLKDAAEAALRANDKELALRLALAAEEAHPEGRGDQLAHYLHRGLGDIFLRLDQPQKAIPHYETAIEKTRIPGYLKDTKASLVEAQEKAEAQKKLDPNSADSTSADSK